MAEGITQAVETEATAQAMPQVQMPEPQAQAQAEPADATDWKAEARKWEARAKENKAKADAYDEAQEAAKSDLEKAQEQAARYKRELDERKKRDEHDALVRKVADEMGVDAKYLPLLTAPDYAGLKAQAELLAEKFAAPVATEGSKPPEVGQPDADMRNFAHTFFGGGN